MSNGNGSNGNGNDAARTTLRLKTERAIDGAKPFVNPHLANVPLARVYEHTNKRGRRYLVGRLASAKVLIFETDEYDPGGARVWEIVLGNYGDKTSVAEPMREHEQQGDAR